MSKPIVLTRDQWRKLKTHIQNDYSPGVLMIREKMRRVLGFVDRVHTTYSKEHGSDRHICLDFYDEPKRVMFLLKYGDYIDKYRS